MILNYGQAGVLYDVGFEAVNKAKKVQILWSVSCRFWIMSELHSMICHIIGIR